MPQPATLEPEITPSVWREMGLNDQEYARVEKILGRRPTYTELGMYAVMWSEHCGLQIQPARAAVFKKYRSSSTAARWKTAGVV